MGGCFVLGFGFVWFCGGCVGGWFVVYRGVEW